MNEQTQPTPKPPRRMAREPGTDADRSEAADSDTAKPGSKIAAVIALLQRPGGATPAELIEATGWLAHTARAALTGLRRKGLTIVRDKRDGATCYRIGGAG